MRIKGIDIKLYGGEGAEIISNVLVGEPSSVAFSVDSINTPAYTLAIPKGDTNEWTDRIVEIFGQEFRTIGFPVQGIEDNIPGAWHKKVSVEKLNINGTCTIYEKDTFTRHVFRDVYFSDNRGNVTRKDGVQSSGKVEIYVYAVKNSSAYLPKIGDIVTSSECSFEFNTESQKTISESMVEFRKESPDYAVIKSVSRKVCGTLPDLHIISR